MITNKYNINLVCLSNKKSQYFHYEVSLLQMLVSYLYSQLLTDYIICWKLMQVNLQD